ncbi:MAG: hypothetical protein ACP5OX_01590 [Minisyncoccia bacterium]
MFFYKIIKFKIKNYFSGVASLVTVISLGTLIFIISLATSIISYYFNQNVVSSLNTQKAYYVSYSGIQDALLKLQRNKDYGSSGYNLSVNSTNDVSIIVSNSEGQATSTATGSYSNFSKKLQNISLVDSTTGLITSTSTTEQNL